MKYLITGHPRTRTAWLSAVMTAHGSPCYHDALTYGVPVGAGLSDPGAACLYVDDALRIARRIRSVCLRREPQESKESLERWAGITLPEENWARACANVDRFSAEHGGPVVLFEELEDNDVVGEIIRECTRQAASSELVSLFQRLRIEQNIEKARLATQMSALTSKG